jgi:hypothetical protein
LTSKEFITKKLNEISQETIKNFPDDFLFPCNTNSITLPPQALIIGNEFFGSYEVLTIKGDPFRLTDSLLKAKYLVYSDMKKDREIKIPVDDINIEAIVKDYEKYLDMLLKRIEKDYKSLFPENKNVNNVVNEVFRLLNLKRL